jgi:cytochrome P450
MRLESKAMSWWDAVRFHALVTLPAGLLGLVAPNRFVLAWFARWDLARLAVRFVAGLQRKYGCGHLWLWFPFARTLLVLDRDSIDAVLNSRDNAADPWLKRTALSRFVPDALVISSGDGWADRRRFNEDVLRFARPLPAAETLRDIAFRAVAQSMSDGECRLRWPDFQRLALRISHEAILGTGQVRPDLAAQLARMAAASNVLLRRPRDFAAFYGEIERLLQRHRSPPDGANRAAAPQACLLQRAARLQDEGRTTPSTCVPSQIGFWFFVLKDALELHVARTLALIAIHPDVQDRVRREIAQSPAAAPGALPLLEACIGEQLRLWTPVPLLLRRATRDFALREAITIKAEQQLLMLAGVYHRDAQVFGAAANRFAPDANRGGSPPVYVFSAGPQRCAGQFVALFLLTATLAALLQRFRFELVRPSLRPDRIPYAFDHFGIELRALAAGAPAP